MTDELRIENQTVHFTTSENLDFLPEQSVDFFMTSPPYWNLKDYAHKDQIGLGEYQEYLARMNKVWGECFRVAKENAVLVINVANRRYKKRLYPIAIDIASQMEGWNLWDILIWWVPNALPQPNHYRERLFDSKYESLLVFIKGDPDSYTFHKPRVPQKYATTDPRAEKKNPKGRCLGNVIRVPAYRPPNVKELGYHVAAYPEELVALMLETFTNPDDVVLDPFLGSGTTCKVAKGMGRRGIGVELNEDYRELISARISEVFELPNWRSLDILHSSTMTPGMVGSRKAHLLRPKTTE